MIKRQEADKVVNAVLDYFKIDINNMSLFESTELYNRAYHAAGII